MLELVEMELREILEQYGYEEDTPLVDVYKRQGLLVEKEKSARVEAYVCYCNVESWCRN